MLPCLATTFLRQERHTAIPSLTIFPFSLHTPKYSHTTLFVPGLLTNEHREFPSAIIDRSLHVHATQIRHVVFGILNNNGNILTTIIGISLKAHIYCTVWTTAHGDNYIPIYCPALTHTHTHTHTALYYKYIHCYYSSMVNCTTGECWCHVTEGWIA